MQIKQHLNWYTKGTDELKTLPRQWLHGLTQRLLSGLACSCSWRALGGDTRVTVIWCLSKTAFCANISTPLQPYPLAQLRAVLRLLEIMLSESLCWSEVLQPVAAELRDVCGLLLRGLQCLQVYIHCAGKFCVIWRGKKIVVHRSKVKSPVTARRWFYFDCPYLTEWPLTSGGRRYLYPDTVLAVLI